jgi:hypothetical protein
MICTHFQNGWLALTCLFTPYAIACTYYSNTIIHSPMHFRIFTAYSLAYCTRLMRLACFTRLIMRLKWRDGPQ